MMRSTDDYYKKYKNIGLDISNGKFQVSEIWNLIALEGLWKLPVPIKHGGLGYGWKGFIRAVEGLISSYGDFDFLSSLISHACLIYLALENKSTFSACFVDLAKGQAVSLRELQIDTIANITVKKFSILNKLIFEKYLYSCMASFIALRAICKINIFMKNKLQFCDSNCTTLNKIIKPNIEKSRNILSAIGPPT